MSRITGCFEALGRARRKALIPFITAGDPDPTVTLPSLHAMVAAGADIIELGVPFSDPMADGPVIQHASERALAHGVSLHDVLQMVSEFRQKDQTTPVVLMGYLNPIEVMGYERFAKEAAAAGVDGVLTVDMPPEEAALYISELSRHEIDPIYLIAPTTNRERIELICNAAQGFVYYVSVKGITGASHLNAVDVASKVAEIRQLTELPVGVGFGIKDADSAAAVAQVADAVIVGSVLVNKFAELHNTPEQIPAALAKLLATMRRALDGSTQTSTF